jgi:hypothetical protein
MRLLGCSRVIPGSRVPQDAVSSSCSRFPVPGGALPRGDYVCPIERRHVGGRSRTIPDDLLGRLEPTETASLQRGDRAKFSVHRQPQVRVFDFLVPTARHMIHCLAFLILGELPASADRGPLVERFCFFPNRPRTVTVSRATTSNADGAAAADATCRASAARGSFTVCDISR